VYLATHGLELIAQTKPQPSPNPALINYYVFDGHRSVRALTDASGAATDSYDYDAFGNLIHSTGTTPNNYLFGSEQFDPDLGLYYNRARYLNVSSGRFWSMDTFEGDDASPPSLHKYLYVSDNPVDDRDPSGLATLVDTEGEIAVDSILEGLATLLFLGVSTGLLGDSNGEPFLSRRDRESNPKKWLYAFGNTQGPRDPRIEGLNTKPGQTPDLRIGQTGLVGPETPPNVRGASTFYNPEIVELTGHVWKVEKAQVQATPGF
jgi:RHS repeat-associated protein